MHRNGVNPEATTATPDDAPQRIVKVRRDYNSWVASETLEDYALRYTPQRFRKWSEWRVANTAFGAASFLILEAVGATLLVQYGFANAFWAILATGLIIFLAGLPISVYAARYGVDMDLLTRGAGFGYIGSTLTSLIYASFTFIFFALEAAVMAYALELALGIPPVWGYLVCALVVIPLVTHGVSAISRLQLWTQPLWLLMLVVPFAYVLVRDPGAFAGIVHYNGVRSGTKGFDLHLFGAALTVGIALITQMGEQADYLRFMPARTAATARRWWAGVLAGGPGWVVLGVLKMLGGALLAYLAITHMVPADRAVDPNQMYLAAYEYVFPHYGWAVAATALFVVISQLKINVTNAYAGSLAWSNFFSRVAHSHPGRVVWVVFNALIAFMLMEMNVFEALGDVLGLFANIAIAWMMAVVADLVINKPLGLSPPGIEFKRAHLWDINPVGVGAMALASGLSITAHLGVFGPLAQAFSALIALGTALVASPLLAWATGGKYYLARGVPSSGAGAVRWARVEHEGSYQRLKVQHCVICEREYEGPDMAHCPAYQGAICSLCCTLDARCGDLCKPHASLSSQWSAVLRWLLPRRSWRYLDTGLGHFLLLMLVIVPLLAVVFGVLYQQELRAFAEGALELASEPDVAAALAGVQKLSLRSGFLKAYMALLVIAGIVAWWLVLAHQSRKVAQEESNRQTHLLVREIELHRETDRALQAAKQSADEAREIAEQAKLAAELAKQAADQANQAKSRYISAISHELRTPLNSILGYAQLMGEDHSVPPHRQQAVAVIKRGGEHLLSLIEGTLAIAHIEAGKLTLHARPMRFADTLRELADMFELQAAEKGLQFRFEAAGPLPEVVRADEKRVCQILINLLGNAIKFTAAGQVTLRLAYAREFASVEIEDTGPGMPAGDIERIFEPFARGNATGTAAAPGAGLGLTIAKMLTDLMGGEMKVSSTPGVGSLFCVRLFLPRVHDTATGSGRALPVPRARRGYEGPRRRLLVVDNEEADRDLLGHLLAPLGFELRSAASGHDALDLVAAGYRPDAMFVDLAMPGIDGWETIRRARKLGLTEASVAIVSANAFDKGLDNDVGIAPEDFFVKPVRHTELLDWLERRLGLQWTDTAAKPAPAAAPRAMLAPSLARLRALEEAVGLGYFRGIMNQLDDIDAAQPECAAWTEAQRVLARQFQFEAMSRALAEAVESAA
ncbi:ATP-binding protein [Variovorax sp. NFACC27]|uniref:hybrid sensor histidine kinase/response regulator n=1 Tax=unclassified Variovorax TaxID=663243 RepID=UPI0008996D31|nr:Signal transduction histidine kinase [Variovorax sp. NFACC28]SEG65468.1 Signal transduction histidine kinase [Variovorax sp. NFACC29]SFC68790.1 Signal transduction histidine kinase [Variovorax sp. NFACC26]SFG80156.1 Signal transduction histidine kinase [Variovorax sp. NFACC27]